MKKLIIRYSEDNSFNRPEIMGEMNKIITKQLSEYGVLFLPKMFEYEVVDIDIEEKEESKYSEWKCTEENYRIGDIVKYRNQLYIMTNVPFTRTFTPDNSAYWTLYEK